MEDLCIFGFTILEGKKFIKTKEHVRNITEN